MVNLKNGDPTLITLALHKGVGHVIVAVGYDPDTSEIQFFNPASGKLQSETILIDYYKNMYKWFTFKSFDEWWASSNSFIRANTFVTMSNQPPTQLITQGGSGGISPNNLYNYR